jgi:adenine-specific DNA-methyltransferase
VKELPDDIDIIYLDPPYNQHPYGSNYFMLNIISRNIEPEELSKVSGIPKKWNKSKYNSKSTAFDAMRDLITESLKKATYILVSYNNEGIIKNEDWIKLLADYEVKKYEIDYDTFRGSRNLKKRSNKVVEIMYLIKYKL